MMTVCPILSFLVFVYLKVQKKLFFVFQKATKKRQKKRQKSDKTPTNTLIKTGNSKKATVVVIFFGLSVPPQLKMSRNVLKGLTLAHNVFKCLKMSQMSESHSNVSKLLKMSKNISQCHEMSQNQPNKTRSIYLEVRNLPVVSALVRQSNQPLRVSVALFFFRDNNCN